MLDLRRAVESAPVAFRRHRDVASDIGALVRLLPETASLQATRRLLHTPLKRLVSGAKALGISRKRAANIKANVKRALAWHEGGGQFAARSLSPAWQALREKTAAHRWERAALAGFMGWCSDRGIAPEAVDSAAVAGFLEHLQSQCPVPDARRRAASTIKAWNAMRRAARPGWPSAELAKLVSIRQCVWVSAYAETFLEDLERYADAITRAADDADSEDRFDENDSSPAPPRKPRRATTARTRKQLLRRAAVRLAEAQGKDLKSITGLAALLAPGAPTAIVRKIHSEKKDAPELAYTLQALVDVAKSYVDADEETKTRLKNLQRRVKYPERVMTEENRRLLRQLSPADFASLYRLPKMLMEAVDRRLRKKERLRPGDIVAARVAVLIAILLYTPLRVSNLVMIRIGKHLTLPQRPGDEAWFAFSAAEMKGGQAFSVPVNAKTSPMLLWYLRKVRPLLAGDAAALFPGEAGPLSPEAVRTNIQKTTAAHMRWGLNPHFFRHLVAHVHLVRHPEDYASVQRLLDHKDLETTKKFYCGEEVDAALRHIAACLAAAGEEIEAEAPPLPRRRWPAPLGLPMRGRAPGRPRPGV